ncbi:MAG: glycosyltransferase [Rhodospirillales bacterium]
MRNVQVQVVQHLQPGGIETMALDLLRCAGEGQDLYVVSLEGTADKALAAWPRLAPFADRLIFLNKRPGWSIATVYRLWRLLRRLGVTAVQTHHVGPLLYGGVAARLASVRRLVHTEHDAWHLRDPHRRILQDSLISLLRPILVADSNLVARELEKVLPKRTYLVIPNGIDCDLFTPGNRSGARAKLGLPQIERIIGCAARLESVKGHNRLFHAHALLPNNVHLALAGTGSLEEDLRILARSLGTEDRIHFLGRIDDMPTFYRALNVFCLPSDREGMPLSPLEAQASGIPCVATDVGGTREAVCPDTGAVVSPADPSFLAEGLTLALSKKPRYNPRAYPLAHCNLSDVVAAYQALLAPEAVR